VFSGRTVVAAKKFGIVLCALALGLTLTQCSGEKSSGNAPVPPTTPTATIAPRPSPPVRTALPRGTAAPGTASPTPSSTESPGATPSGSPTSSVVPVTDEDEKVLYFTFDDGPNPPYTTQILDILAKHNAHGTFFVLGEALNEHPEIVEKIRAAGHAIGNHTHDHKSLPSLSADEVRQEMTTGPRSKCFRPPYGAMNDEVREVAADLGVEVVLWNVDPRDWDEPGTDTIVDRVLSNKYSGAIILMHDGGGDRSQTVEALERLLTKLSADGYSFKSLKC
jgi:peptidoglycan-N-acetylglucosamine deacetylase